MSERGWGWTRAEIRQVHLAEWLARQSADQYISVVEFYDALPDQSMNNWDAAHSDLKSLEERGMISLSVAMGGIRGLHVSPGQGVRDLAEELKAVRANKRMRKAACRDAMVDWLHSLDATSELEMPVRDAMLDDPRHGIWFGEPFTADDLDEAAAWLERQGLVKGISVAGARGPVRLYLTDAGVTCAEDFDSYAARYLDAQSRGPRSGPILNIGTNSGPFQMAGDHAHQVQNIGASADDLRQLISSIAEMVRTMVPGVTGLDEQEQTALAAATPGSVDRSVLQKFADWVLATVRAGATAALVPAVSAATNEMLTEAGRLTAHLG
jgi:hypothetical protein